MRPRIRTLKPEFYGDEKVRALSEGARFTTVGLISYADDRGRGQLLLPAIWGFIYPGRDVSLRGLDKRLRQIFDIGIAVTYEVAAQPYLWLPNFWRHQVINRPTESLLPAHPEDPYRDLPIAAALKKFREDSLSDHGGLTASRAGGRSLPTPFPSSSTSTENDKSQPSSARIRQRVDQSQPPTDFPAEKLAHLIVVLAILRGVWDVRGGVEPQERGVGLGMLRNPRADHVSVARKLEHWLLAGRGQTASCGDIAKRFGDWCADEPAAKPQAAANGATSSELDRSRLAALNSLMAERGTA